MPDWAALIVATAMSTVLVCVAIRAARSCVEGVAELRHQVDLWRARRWSAREWAKLAPPPRDTPPRPRRSANPEQGDQR